MPPLHPSELGRLLDRVGPPADAVLTEMHERAEREGFPTVGPEVGRALALCTRLLGARSAVELGSGFGYSAYWIARALPAGGNVVLTEGDADRLADAESYFERGGLADRATFECGDALELVADREETFDLVVLDHDTADYAHGFEAVRERVAVGGALVADNVLVTGEKLTVEGLLATLDGERPPNERTRAVAEFYRRVSADPAFEPYALPVGEGLLVAPRVD